MAEVNFSKPAKSRLGHRRTLCLKQTNDSTIYPHNVSLVGQTSGAFSNQSNPKRGVNKCLFGKNKNQSYHDFEYSETPRSACFNVTENKHKHFYKQIRSNSDEMFESTLNYCGEYNVRSGNENNKNVTNFSNAVTVAKNNSVKNTGWTSERFSAKDVTKHQRSTFGQDSENYFLSKVIPFTTPGGKEDAFPDLESREKDDNYAWSVFKTRKSSTIVTSPRKNSYNFHSRSKQEHSPLETNTDTINMAKPSVGPHRFLQYQSGVLLSPKAPTRSFSCINIKIEEPPILTQSLNNSTSNANGKQCKQTIATECNLPSDDSPNKSVTNDSFNSGHNSTDSFIENETTLVQLDDINFNNSYKNKLSTHMKRDNEDKCQPADNKNSIMTGGTEEKSTHNIKDSFSVVTLFKGVENEDHNQEASWLSSLVNTVGTKSVSPAMNKMLKLSPSSVTRHSGRVISTKIRRSFINCSKSNTPVRSLKDLRAKQKQCEDDSVTDYNTMSDYFSLTSSSKKTRLSTVIEHETEDRSQTVNSVSNKEPCTSMNSNERTNIEPPESIDGTELHEKEFTLLSTVMNDIVQRHQKIDSLLNSFLLEKQIVDKQLVVLFSIIKKCINQQPELVKRAVSTTLNESTNFRPTPLIESVGSPVDTQGTPINQLCNPSPKMSVNSKCKFKKTSAAQAYSALRASYNCLRTPISSQQKKNKQYSCYTPHSLSMCVDEQMKDIFGE